MNRDQQQSEQDQKGRAEQESHTAMIEQRIIEGADYDSMADL